MGSQDLLLPQSQIYEYTNRQKNKNSWHVNLVN